MSDTGLADAAERDSGPSPAASRWRDLLALGIAWIPYALLVRRFWFVTDDAYISFRYARNWATGIGLRYNPGDHVPVEGFSNFLWVALASGVERAGLDPAVWMPALSTLSGLALTALVYRVLRESFGTGRTVAALSVGALGCAAPFAVWTTGGLETMSFGLLLFLLYRALVLRPRQPASVQGGLLGVLVSLSRPEGLYWVLLLFGLACLSRRRRREPTGALRFSAILVVGVALYEAWRIHTFGHFLPTSATAKLSAGIGLDRLARGYHYVALQFLSTTSLFVLFPAVGVVVRDRARRGVLPALALALGFPVWTVLVSGDFMAFGRFLVPGLPYLALLGGLLLDRLAGPDGRRLPLAALVASVVAGLGALPAWNHYPVPRSVRERLDFRPHLDGFRSEFAYWSMQRIETRRWVERGKVLASISKPGDSIVLSAIGAVGYYSGLYVYDRIGLVSREVAELEPAGDALDRTPGHDNPVEAKWFLDRGYRPTFVRANFHGAGSPSELEEQVARAKYNLRESDLMDAYVLEVWQLASDGDGTESESSGKGGDYFFVWRRIAEDTPARLAWEEFDRTMAEHLAGGALPTVRLPD